MNPSVKIWGPVFKLGGNGSAGPARRRPAWLRKKTLPGRMAFAESALRGVRTVCREARCPNISECWEKKTATFMILGSVCTRRCGFCAVRKGEPWEADPEEPARITGAALRLGIKHAVVTSPTRDDIQDGGAGAFVSAAGSLAEKGIRVELLIPDFNGNRAAVTAAAFSGADIIGHNMETVRRLYGIRPGASYERSVSVLRVLKESRPEKKIKSGFMVGLGESEEEAAQLIEEIRAAGCSFLSIGQYLQPDRSCVPVKEYVSPERFRALRERALDAGFEHVESGPYVRSSYMAERYCDE